MKLTRSFAEVLFPIDGLYHLFHTVSKITLDWHLSPILARASWGASITRLAAMKRMHLGVSMRGIGYHPSGWRVPGVQLDGAIDIRHMTEIARISERGLLDFVFLADQSALNFNNEPQGAFGRNQEGCCEFEPITLLAALSQVTTHIGLIATASTTFHQPYQLARQFLSLDHMSGGRAGWNVVTSSRNAEAQNYGSDSIINKDERYNRAKEAIEVAFGLWECWEPDAFIRDLQRGQFFDPQKLHRLDHKGANFGVRGPLTMSRSPQGRPVIAQAGASAEGTDFAAGVADIIYAVQTTIDEAKRFYKTTKDRVRAKGRNPDEVKILPGILPIVGSTEEEAHRKYRALLSHLDPVLGLERLTRFFGDLSGHDLDGPLPELRTDVTLVSRASMNLRLARERKWSIRRLYEETIISHGHHVCIGTPEMIADEMQVWTEMEAADGFNIVPAVLPASLSDFVEQVVPILQSRGLFRNEYEFSTLRGNLGLPKPPPRHSLPEQ